MSDWMGRLPCSVKKKPFCTLCIPGSHDSGAHWFNLQLGYAHDQSFLRYICSFQCSFVKRIVKRWGLTQSLSIEEQLVAGIRFFDIRLELALDTRESMSCFIVHGLYSTDWLKLAKQIGKFLQAHDQEVVILNVSHIYRMSDYDFRRFFLHPLSMVAERCGVQLCSTREDLRTVSLETLVESNFRIIVVGPLDQDMDECCFRSASIQNKWPNRNNTADLLNFLQAQIHQPVTPGLRVLQGVVTPQMKDIIRNFRSSLRVTFSLPMRSISKTWLRQLDAEEIGNLNIMITDQVDTEFCRLVYFLNVNDCMDHKLDPYTVNPHLDGKEWPPKVVVESPVLDVLSTLSPEPILSEQERFIKAIDELSEPEILIEQIFDDFDVSVSSLPPRKPNRASVMIQQVEMVLETDTSSENTSSLPRSPVPPPKPKRFTQRIPIVMEVVPIPDDETPIIYPDVPMVPISRSSDTPVRIALPVTEEELRLAALGEYPSYRSQRSYRREEKKEEVKEEVEDDESADESAPLISHEVESMVEDLVINSTIDAMDNLAGHFKCH
ncbi:hypothetical protein CRE_27652 [Caenorhabditis remanei]|uniref:Phosphatidylinositol-specific phospholipase C X domain-containing protein n=1 Tax=Caenorhabditis remanei TaxID=31234 RepID=E3MKR6_CAERE|nr:hypothetical protein CRE_27652 [Caenorhabditis remanei]